MKKYSLAIIGAGSAGLSAADVASQLGLSGVVLIEKEDKLGGECLHSGCVPSKALIHAGQTFNGDAKKAWAHVRASIDAIEHRSDNIAHVKKSGVDVLQGEVSFLKKRILTVGSETIRARSIIVATGSSPSVPPIPGLDTVPYLTNETFFSQQSLPKSMVIIGGGPIGCELAGALASLKISVTLIQSADRLLPRETPEVSEIIAASLRQKGVMVLLNAETASVDKTAGGVAVKLKGKRQAIEAQKILVAAGRTPRTAGFGLETIGVNTNQMGIVTDKYLRTNRKYIYAAGDVTTSPKFTHLAAQQAGLAVRNILSGPFRKSVSSLSDIPAITFTDPEVARIGLDSVAAASKGFTVERLNYNEIDRAITDEQAGFIEVAVDAKGLIVGATVVGAHASEILAPLLVAMRHKVPLGELATTMFPYPTLASGVNILASRYATKKAASGAALSVIRRFWK